MSTEILIGCLISIGILVIAVVLVLNLKIILKSAIIIIAGAGVGALAGYMIDRLAGEYPTWTLIGAVFFGLGAAGGVVTYLRGGEED